MEMTMDTNASPISAGESSQFGQRVSRTFTDSDVLAVHESNHENEVQPEDNAHDDPLADKLRSSLEIISGHFEQLYNVLNDYRDFTHELRKEEENIDAALKEEEGSLETAAQTLIQQAQELAQNVMAQWFEAK